MAKIILDPDADGKQWIYKDCLIVEQIHPKLLRYACYTKTDEFIGVSNTKTNCKEIIENFLILKT